MTEEFRFEFGFEYQCPYCPEMRRGKAQLHIHMMMAHPGRRQLGLLEADALDALLRRQPVQDEPTEQPTPVPTAKEPTAMTEEFEYQCPYCPEMRRGKKRLHNHMMMMHPGRRQLEEALDILDRRQPVQDEPAGQPTPDAVDNSGPEEFQVDLYCCPDCNPGEEEPAGQAAPDRAGTEYGEVPGNPVSCVCGAPLMLDTSEPPYVKWGHAMWPNGKCVAPVPWMGLPTRQDRETLARKLVEATEVLRTTQAELKEARAGVDKLERRLFQLSGAFSSAEDVIRQATLTRIWDDLNDAGLSGAAHIVSRYLPTGWKS